MFFVEDYDELYETSSQDVAPVPVNCRHDTQYVYANPAGVGYLSSMSTADAAVAVAVVERPRMSSSTTTTDDDDRHHRRRNDDVTYTCPTWIVEASRGQRIQLTMAAFGGAITSGLSGSRGPETDEEVSQLVAGARSDACYELGIASSEPQIATTTSLKHTGLSVSISRNY